jgi:D-glycero-alpha-D-manno-heptose-7-phosphate kinase
MPVLIVRSPLRISFAGGGTDLPAYYENFGGAVLSSTINKYFYTVLSERRDGRIQITSSDSHIFESWHEIAAMNATDGELEIPVAVLRELDEEVSIDLFLASEIPPGTGLGSSASECTSILKALTTYLNHPLSKYGLAERAFHITRDAVGRHVGRQDEFATAFGGLNLITFRPDGHTEVERIDLRARVLEDLQSSLMLFFTGSAQYSWTILQEEEQKARHSAGPTIEALHEVHAVVEQMVPVLKSGDLDHFGALLDESWQRKKRVSAWISNARIDYLYNVARRNGALGGKITGAGSGGFLLLYCVPERQEDVRAALMEEGVTDMTFSFVTEGVQVMVNDSFIDADGHGSRHPAFHLISRYK